MHCKASIVAFLVGCLSTAFVCAESPIRPGDRIAIVGNTFADQLRIHSYLETLLLQHTMDDPVSIRNLGWGGDMLTARDRPTGFPTEESTLTAHKTDIIVACFGMGESFLGVEGLEKFRIQLKAFLASHAGKKYNGKSEVRLILVSPIACEDMGELNLTREKRNRELQAYARAMQEVAIDVDIPFVDLFNVSRYLMDEPNGPRLTSNGIHLNHYGYWAISHTFYDQLTASDRVPKRQSWRLRINATAKSVDARGVDISDLKRDDSGLSFQVTEKTAPSLRPPTTETLPPQLESVRDTLIITDLKPGKYRLTIDDKPVATATAATWAEGVAVDSSPAHQATEAYHAVINDKNMQFTYSWKALNQVHIVGERRGSPSGKELPQEVIEFNRLTNDLDQALRKGIELRVRQWRVSRVGS